MQLFQASASSVGSKILIALTGLGLFVFLIGHLAGNLLFLVGPDAFNHYSHTLTSNPLIYLVEAGLVGVFFLHVAKTVAGVLANRAARPTGYASRRWAKTKNPRSRKTPGLVDDDRDRDHRPAVRGHPPRHLQVRHLLRSRRWHRATSIACSSRSSARRATSSSTCSRWPSSSSISGTASRARRSRSASITCGRVARPSRPRPRAGDRHRGRVLHHSDLHLPPLEGRAMTLDSRIPSGPIAEKWDRRKFENKLVNPANRRKHEIIVVGTGLAGASAAASLGELGYKVKLFGIHDSPRRAHSIAAQGGINAAKNYRNDGDSIYRLFYDTVKGGDYRAREANVFRLAQMSVRHHRPVRRPGGAVRARVRRAARQPLVRRRPGVAHVLRARPDRPAAAARRLPVADAPGGRRHGDDVPAPRDAGPRGGQRPGSRHRLPQPDHRRARVARRQRGAAVHGRLRHGVLPVDQRRQLERHGRLARPQAGRLLRQPLLHADSPDLHPRQRRPPVEADADVREPPQRRPRVGAEEPGRPAPRRPDSGVGARLLPRAPLPELRQPGAA